MQLFPRTRVFSNKSALHIRWPKYWSFPFSISPSNEYSGLISFRMFWLDLHTVRGTLKSLLQHHYSKTSILQHSTFCGASWVFQTVKNLHSMQENQVQFLSWKDPLEKGMATLPLQARMQYSCLVNSWTKEPGRLQSMGLQRVGHG